MLEIDQSGKIEDTAKPTVLAFSNDTNGTLILSAQEKRLLQEIYRKAGKPRVFILQVFTACLYLLFSKYKLTRRKVIIDREYRDDEGLIKSYINQMANHFGKTISHMEFAHIGKRSPAHYLGNMAFKNRKADKTITASDVLGLVILLEKR